LIRPEDEYKERYQNPLTDDLEKVSDTKDEEASTKNFEALILNLEKENKALIHQHNE
jgi:hypothetical protein